MMKKLFILSAVLIACEPSTTEGRQQARNEVVEDIRYLKDNRTNLCFAYGRWWNNGRFLTNVPCTPEVEAQIK